jgi:hypothetical protein
MNRSQLIVLAVAAFDLGLMLLFPPFDSISSGRTTATFDAFYFAFGQNYTRFINWNLLGIEFGWVIVNAAIGWLLLRNYRRGRGWMSRRNAVLVWTMANLLVILLFPPFENYASALVYSGTYFDGFYFAFGDKGSRHLYVPLLYMEVLWPLVNGAALWLLFRDRQPAGR